MRKGDVRPIYSQEFDIRSGGIRVLRLCLNRHLPERDWVAPHRHSYSQFLVYLNGRGVQRIEEESFQVHPGSLCYLPPGVPHSFVETEGRRPLCLAVDLRMGTGSDRTARLVRMTESEINRVRHALAGLTRWQTGPVEVEPAEAAVVLQVVDLLLRCSSHLPRQRPDARPAIVNRVLKVLAQDGSAGVAQVAAAVGYHPDHLTRMLKSAAGLSVGRLRSESRLQRAKDLLKTTRQIQDAAGQLGFEDPNYFSRWFRHQTGLSPSDWRRQVARP